MTAAGVKSAPTAPAVRPPAGLLIQPDVVKPPVGVDIVLLENEILDVRMPTQSGNGLVDDRPGDILGKFLLHRPYELLARRKIGLLRLLIDHLIDLGVAVSAVVRPGAVSPRLWAPTPLARTPAARSQQAKPP